MVPNTFKVPKYTWVKWRECAQLVYNDLVANGVAEKKAEERAWEVTQYAMSIDHKFGPLPEEEKAPEPVEEAPPEAPKPAKKPAAKRKKPKKAE